MRRTILLTTALALRVAGCAVVGCGVVGCGVGGGIGRGMAHYREGYYPAAMAVWTDLAPYGSQMNFKGHVRYLVFRGLTHYRLRQLPAARHFLTRGVAAYRRGPPDVLPPFAVHELRTALRELARTGAGARPARPGAPDRSPPRAPSVPPPSPEQPSPPNAAPAPPS